MTSIPIILPIRVIPSGPYLIDGSKALIARAMSEDEVDVDSLNQLAALANSGHPDVAKVLDAVSLWLTGTGRHLARVADDRDANRPEVSYESALEGLIADVEGLRANMGQR